MLKLKRVDLPSTLQLGHARPRALIVPHDRETVDFSLISCVSIPALKSPVFRSPHSLNSKAVIVLEVCGGGGGGGTGFRLNYSNPREI